MFTPITLSAFMLAVAFPFASSAREMSIKEKAVPAPILDAFHSAYPNAKAMGFSKETEEGKTIYEVESVDGSVKRDLQYLADGTLQTVEEGIAVAALPDAVTKSLKQAYPKSSIHNAEKITENGAVKYECIVENAKRWMEIVFDGNGIIMKKEMKRGGATD